MDMSCLPLRKAAIYGRDQVFGHVASGHGYQSRVKNGRWNIHEAERRKEIKEIIRPGNIDMYMAQEINYGNIELEIIGAALIFKCLKCARLPIFQDTRPISIRNHLSHAHRKFPAGGVICPYFQAAF